MNSRKVGIRIGKALLNAIMFVLKLILLGLPKQTAIVRAAESFGVSADRIRRHY